MIPHSRNLLPTCLFAAALTAQTGSIDPTEEQLAGLKVAAPPTIELIEEKVVDLRRWLPPIGEQSMNDCTAWAVGYAAKSFLEARDQGWRPDAPQRIFSPSFLYNQLNGGKDDGTNFVKMVRLMSEKGAATLATAPYRAGDFTSQPDARAFAEATAFPVLDLELLRSRKAIRRALQRRQVVVFGAHVNPIFLSGRFDTYAAALFVQDCKLRQPNQRHGKHAMVLVGYDDDKGCFLLQNSWGTRWNQRGYAWVQYELFDDIRIAQDDSVFCNWACTIEDVEQPVTPGAGGSVAHADPVDRSTLKADGYADISRYDRTLERFVYVFSADLRGPRALLGEVKSVTWRWTDEQNQPRTFTADDAASRFALTAGTTQNPLPLAGTVTFADGKTQAITASIQGPNPKADFREAKIVFEDDYYGPVAGGDPQFWWEATLDFPLEQRDDITKVVWNLGTNMNSREPVQTMTGFNGKPGEEHAIGMCQKPSRIEAEIHYIDGGIKKVQLDPVLTDNVSEQFAIEVDKRCLGTTADGRPSWSWVLTVDRPHRKQFDIESVDWTLDPSFSPSHLWANSTFSRFATYGTADRDFRAVATLHLKGGATETLERWIELGPGTGYPDDDRIDVASWNRYLGGESGEPTFTGHTIVVGDRRALEQVAKVFVTEVTGTDHQEYQIATDPKDPTWAWSCDGGAEAVLDYRFVFADGREKKLHHVHRRTLLPDDCVGFHVDMQARPETYLDFHHQDTHLYTAQPAGPDQSLLRVVGIEWQHAPIGYRERTVQSILRTGLPAAQALTSVLTAPSRLEARLHYHTGWEETVGTDLTRLSNGDLVPDLQLRVQEKFWGYENGRPSWAETFEIARDAKAWPAPVATVTYTVRAIDGGDGATYAASTPNGYTYVRVPRPSTVHAEVTFTDGRSATLDGFAATTAVRRNEPVSLLRYHNNYSVPHEKRWLLVVDAWESQRDQLASVSWDSSSDQDYFDRKDDFKDGVPGVIVYERSSDPETMTVVATAKDGRSWKWEVPVGEPIAPVSWAWSKIYWGDGYWQVDARAVGDWWLLKDLGRSFRLDGAPGLQFDTVGAWPASRLRARAKPGVYEIPGGTFAGGGKLSGAKLELGQHGEATPEALSLTVSASPFTNAGATVPEWILGLAGPERLLGEITAVDYEFEDADGAHAGTVTQRWGEFYAGFEHRAFAATKPLAKARVHLRDGTTQELASAPR